MINPILFKVVNQIQDCLKVAPFSSPRSNKASIYKKYENKIASEQQLIKCRDCRGGLKKYTGTSPICSKFEVKFAVYFDFISE